MTTYTEAEILEHRRLWVEALRSGRYAQAKLMLRDDGYGFCCLGVACEVAITAGVIDEYIGLDGMPPPDVRNWLGLDGPYGRTGITNEVGHLAELTTLNDDHDFTFVDIADVIDDGLLLIAEDVTA